VHESDEIDRSLSIDEPMRAAPRLLAHVMTEIRAMTRPAPPTFPWHEFSLRLASYSGLAAAAAMVSTSVDPAVFVPVARELVAAGAAVSGALATIHVGRHFE
jgi:hypothetical protein